jgi:hypothetical protein
MAGQDGIESEADATGAVNDTPAAQHEGMGRDQSSDPFRNDMSFGPARVPHDQEKLLSPPSRDRIRVPHGRSKERRDLDQDPVPRVMAVFIVHALEMVHVQHGQHQVDVGGRLARRGLRPIVGPVDLGQ